MTPLRSSPGPCAQAAGNLRITELESRNDSFVKVVKRTMDVCTTVISVALSASPVTAAHPRAANTIATNVKRYNHRKL